MAYPFQRETGLTQEQADVLRELNSFAQFSASDVWQKLKKRLQQQADEASEELLGCPIQYTLAQRGVLAIRWQQRVAIQRDLIAFVESHLDERQKLIDEIGAQNGIASDTPDTTH